MSLYSPERSLKYETIRPSGDHAGLRPADALDAVRVRTSPFSAGLVKLWPSASTAARRRDGESAMLTMRFETSFHWVIIHGKSPVAEICTIRDWSPSGSSSCTQPPCSKTTAPPPASSDFTSKSVNFVTWRSFRPDRSYAQTFETPSRSETK